MEEHIRRGLIALLSLGLAAGFSMSAMAQEIIEESYEVDGGYAPEVIIEDDYVDEPDVIIAERDGFDRCAATFRSFDPDSGTYVTYAGETLRCPYLE